MKKITKKETIKLRNFALLGSVLGNIIQAINQASTERDFGAVRQTFQKVTADKNFLLGRLKQWQKAYSSLKEKTNKLEQEVEELENAMLKQKEETYGLQKEQLNKDEQINNLRKENEELKKEIRKLKEEKGG